MVAAAGTYCCCHQVEPYTGYLADDAPALTLRSPSLTLSWTSQGHRRACVYPASLYRNIQNCFSHPYRNALS
ncbi:hypothetical protein E2C01_050750 [Portunus trituberculatus]|uniref:Uncharacterized protein n=1 Tax=Portunus trituberculatus TaxID=210409 RepID=A0A5B7GJT2_PORTR|nr:hypothetical protein [Portunus trituberculatus]